MSLINIDWFNIIRNSDFLKNKRKKRLQKAISKINYDENSVILDVGCGKKGRSLEPFIKENKIVGLDLHEPNEIQINQSNFEYIQGDAEDMSNFENNQFDIAFCIGMLEHITDKKKLKNISEEIRRVSKQYVIIVPYRYAIIEPHFKFPLFPIYPYSLKVSITKLFNPLPLGNAVREDPDFIKGHIKWLKKEEWKKYFPEADIDLIFFEYLLLTGKTN